MSRGVRMRTYENEHMHIECIGIAWGRCVSEQIRKAEEA